MVDGKAIYDSLLRIDSSFLLNCKNEKKPLLAMGLKPTSNNLTSGPCELFHRCISIVCVLASGTFDIEMEL